ncbi:MAG: NAD(P)H-dependent oxidoreductase subunit E [Planctomycetes bacterium]|nr:NAD(P)H-dependent oxidoreductase subunit E [Planctomycetota bacterium]
MKQTPPQGGVLIRQLHGIQSRLNYLPREELERVSEQLDIPLSQVYSVATFFTSFSLTPVGKHVVNVCVGTTCHVKGASGIVEYMERRLEIPLDGISDDGLFTLRTLRCLGCCSLAPVMKIGDKVYGHLTRAKAEKIIQRIRKAPS